MKMKCRILEIKVLGLVGWLLAPLEFRFRKNYAIYILLLFEGSLKILVMNLSRVPFRVL